jgi:hypothetical protein
MKNAVFWDVAAATCSCWFLARGFFYPEDGGDKLLRKMVHTISTWRHIPEDAILHSHHGENLKSYKTKDTLNVFHILLLALFQCRNVTVLSMFSEGHITITILNFIDGTNSTEILVYHAEGGIHRSRNRPSA